MAGRLNAVYYDSANIVSPSSVSVGNQEYELSGSDVKFMFSINGDIEVGDEVILIVQQNTSVSSDGTEEYVYYCTGVVSYSDLTGTTTGTTLVQNPGYYNANTGESVNSFGDTSSSESNAGAEGGNK